MIYFFGNVNSKVFAVQTTKELSSETISKLTWLFGNQPKIEQASLDAIQDSSGYEFVIMKRDLNYDMFIEFDKGYGEKTYEINFIDGKCRQLDIDVFEFINSGEKTYKSIQEVSKKTASKMLAMLNEYQNKSKPTPAKIVGYNSNWRES